MDPKKNVRNETPKDSKRISLRREKVKKLNGVRSGLQTGPCKMDSGGPWSVAAKP